MNNEFVKCPKCGKEYRNQYRQCPICKTPNPTWNQEDFNMAEVNYNISKNAEPSLKTIANVLLVLSILGCFIWFVLIFVGEAAIAIPACIATLLFGIVFKAFADVIINISFKLSQISNQTKQEKE